MNSVKVNQLCLCDISRDLNDVRFPGTEEIKKHLTLKGLNPGSFILFLHFSSRFLPNF